MVSALQCRQCVCEALDITAVSVSESLDNQSPLLSLDSAWWQKPSPTFICLISSLYPSSPSSSSTASHCLSVVVIRRRLGFWMGLIHGIIFTTHRSNNRRSNQSQVCANSFLFLCIFHQHVLEDDQIIIYVHAPTCIGWSMGIQWWSSYIYM